MKAPTKVDKFLIANGFTYRRPYYQRLSRRVPLMECLNFSKHKPGLMIHVVTAYVDPNGGPQISPMELSVMYVDGRFSGAPGALEIKGFWNASATDQLIEGLDSFGFRQLDRLATPELMLRTVDFLLGSKESDCLVEFPELAQPWVERKVTPVRLMCKAAYLNLLDRFEEAKVVIAQVSGKSKNPFDDKIEGDADIGRIRFLSDVRNALQTD